MVLFIVPYATSFIRFLSNSWILFLPVHYLWWELFMVLFFALTGLHGIPYDYVSYYACCLYLSIVYNYDFTNTHVGAETTIQLFTCF